MGGRVEMWGVSMSIMYVYKAFLYIKLLLEHI